MIKLSIISLFTLPLSFVFGVRLFAVLNIRNTFITCRRATLSAEKMTKCGEGTFVVERVEKYVIQGARAFVLTDGIISRSRC